MTGTILLVNTGEGLCVSGMIHTCMQREGSRIIAIYYHDTVNCIDSKIIRNKFRCSLLMQQWNTKIKQLTVIAFEGRTYIPYVIRMILKAV